MPLRVLRFVETVDGATYTAVTNLPRGSRLIDILMETTVAWTAATADLDIGDFNGADTLMSAADLTSTFSASVGSSGASGWANPPNPYSNSGAGILYPNGTPITAVVTATTPGGPTGISQVCLFFEPVGAGQLARVTT